MILQLRRLDLHEVGLHVLDDSVANRHWQEPGDTEMDRGRCREGPAIRGFAFHHLRNVFSELVADALVVFGLEGRSLRD